MHPEYDTPESIMLGMWKWLLPVAALAVITALAGCGGGEEAAKPDVVKEKPEPMVIELEMYPKKAPKTVERIVALIEEGFYDKQRFHRVETWVIQWGSPASRDTDLRDQTVGAGGSGKPNLPYETNDIKMEPGTLAMASTGEKVGGDCQMFILTSRVEAQQAEFLQGNYAAFGKVTSGQEMVDKVQIGDFIEMSVTEKTDDVVKVKLTVTPYG